MENGSKVYELICEGNLCGVCHNNILSVSRGICRVYGRKEHCFRFRFSSIIPGVHGEIKYGKVGTGVFDFVFGCSAQGEKQGCVGDIDGTVEWEVGTFCRALAGETTTTGSKRGILLGEEFEEGRIVWVEGGIKGFHCYLKD